MRTIPFVDLKAQYRPLKEQITVRLEETLEGMQLFLGDNVCSFEREFADFCGTSHGVGVSDGTSALEIALRACGVGPGDEVITVANTFIATAEAIALVGAKPVFVDTEPESALMDVSQVTEMLSPRTKAIIPVHLYGQMADMDLLLAIARERGLKIVEDACQAHGAERNGKRAGSIGDVGCFSFYFSKNLGAYGEGGFVTTNDDDLARRVQMIRDHGSQRRYYHDSIGRNARLDELQAAFLRIKLPYLQRWNHQRRILAEEYGRRLSSTPLVLPVEMPGNLHVYHLYVVSAPRRDQLQRYLMDHGIATGIHYPIPCHLQKAFAHLGFEVGSFPVTEASCESILSLPMYPELSVDDIAYVSDKVKEFYLTR